MLEQRIEQDLKAALLAGEKTRVSVLRGIKSVILYAKVAEGKRESGLTDEAVIGLLAKEAKKRQESADLYEKGNDPSRAQAELEEKAIIESYLPQQLSEEEITEVINEVVSDMGDVDMKVMGQVIAKVKQKTQGAADGAVIARLVKNRVSQ